MKIGTLSPPRKRGSTSGRKNLDSRFRGNDNHRVIFDRAASRSDRDAAKNLHFLNNPDLPRHPSAIHHQDVAVNVIRGVRREKDNRAFQIVRAAPMAGGNASGNLPRPRRVLV